MFVTGNKMYIVGHHQVRSTSKVVYIHLDGDTKHHMDSGEVYGDQQQGIKMPGIMWHI